MKRYLLGRLGGSLITLFIATFVVFVLVRLIPGDPIATLMTTQYDEDVADSLRKLYGLDRPIFEQFTSWLGSIAHGEFGKSILSGTDVSELLIPRIPRTLVLMGGGIAVALLIAIPAGIVAAVYRGRWPDAALMGFTTVLMAIPQFWLGILLIVIFAVTLQVLPGAGFVPWTESPADFLRSLILPWLTIGFSVSAFIARVLRSSLLDTLSQDYIRTADARGLGPRSVVLRHALRNAAVPTVTVIGLEIGYLVGGSIVVETVFAYPGVGQLLVTSIQQRDYPIIQIGLLFFAAGFVVVNLLTDLSYGLIDPRIRR